MKHLIKTALVLLALIIPATALAHDFEVDGIYYNINGTTATVTYKGTSYSQYSNEYSGSVTIPATVTYNGTTYSVTTIGNDAFRSCGIQTTINIPNSVTTIGKYAFYNCYNLTTIKIPNSVTTIGSWAFSSCSSLASISVVSDNPKYDSRNNCNAIIETATNKLIVGCKNTIIPNSVTTIDGTAFYYCTSLTTINIPNSVSFIGDYAFSDCRSLTSINIPNSVTTIGFDAFSGCTGLTTLNIPNSVTSIGQGAFSNCTSLTSISVASDNPKYDSRNNCNAIIETKTNTLIFGCKNTTIPNSVTTIGSDAFRYCYRLTTISIPNSVTLIGASAFYYCTSLTAINIGNSVTRIAFGAFQKCLSLNDVYCYATTPPECSSSFSNYSATLHVPAASLAAYFTAPVWSNFENIVGDAVAPTGITISKDNVEMPLGEQIELTATVTPANASCKEVSWYSTDPSVATIENGIVTAVGYGECDIYAYCMGMPAICHVSVSNRISLEQNEAMLLPNHMLVLNPTAPAMPSGFTVTSSDPTVAAARVMNGKVQIVGIKEGTTTITVASSDGTAQPATCLVTVYTELGDANCDGFLNISDLTLLIDYLMNNETTTIKETNADLNSDGNINIADVTALIDHLLTTD